MITPNNYIKKIIINIYRQKNNMNKNDLHTIINY